MSDRALRKRIAAAERRVPRMTEPTALEAQLAALSDGEIEVLRELCRAVAVATAHADREAVLVALQRDHPRLAATFLPWLPPPETRLKRW